MAGLRPETVKLWGREAHDLTISDERAQAIAAIIEPQATIANASVPSVPFDAEPADFVRALHRWRSKTR